MTDAELRVLSEFYDHLDRAECASQEAYATVPVGLARRVLPVLVKAADERDRLAEVVRLARHIVPADVLRFSGLSAPWIDALLLAEPEKPTLAIRAATFDALAKLEATSDS